jgi:hypothetical protein
MTKMYHIIVSLIFTQSLLSSEPNSVRTLPVKNQAAFTSQQKTNGKTTVKNNSPRGIDENIDYILAKIMRMIQGACAK